MDLDDMKDCETCIYFSHRENEIVVCHPLGIIPKYAIESGFGCEYYERSDVEEIKNDIQRYDD